jgi:hypothetical protein
MATTYTDAVSESGVVTDATPSAMSTNLSDTADGSDGTSSTQLITLTEKGSGAGIQQVGVSIKLSGSATLADALHPTYGVLIRDYARMAASLGVNSRYTAILEEAAGAAEKLRIGASIGVSEAATLAWALSVTRGVLVAEKLKIREILNYPVRYGWSVLERIRAYDALSNFFHFEVGETATITETMLGVGRHFAELDENLLAGDEVFPHLIISIEALDDGVFSDDFNIKMIYQPEVHEHIWFRVAIASPSGGITTWTVNTRTGAVTEYENFDFNSFAQSGVHYLAASSNGLYILDGDDDAGTSIVSRLKSGYLQFGGALYAGIKAAYLGVRAEAGSTIYLKIETATEGTYVYKGVVQNEQTTKVRLGKGLRARYYSWELETVGQDFDLDTVEFIPLVAQRRV